MLQMNNNSSKLKAGLKTSDGGESAEAKDIAVVDAEVDAGADDLHADMDASKVKSESTIPVTQPTPYKHAHDGNKRVDPPAGYFERTRDPDRIMFVNQRLKVQSL